MKFEKFTLFPAPVFIHNSDSGSVVTSWQARNEEGKMGTIPRASSHYGGA